MGHDDTKGATLTPDTAEGQGDTTLAPDAEGQDRGTTPAHDIVTCEGLDDRMGEARDLDLSEEAIKEYRAYLWTEHCLVQSSHSPDCPARDSQPA